MLFVVSEESHRQQMESKEIREDGKQVETAAVPKRVMIMQHACPALSQILTTADLQKPARRIGEAIQVAVTVLENQNDEEVPIQVVAAVAVAEVPCPGFETA